VTPSASIASGARRHVPMYREYGWRCFGDGALGRSICGRAVEWGLGWTGSGVRTGVSQSGYGFESEFESGSTGHRKSFITEVART
jgi:hypothetical protein